MADEVVAITAGSGTNIATDDAGAGGHVQVVKLAIATDASRTPIPADASGLLVKSATAANFLNTEANSGSILTSVQLIDDAIYVDDTATHATGTSKGVLIMGAATPTDTAVSANDIGAVAMNNNRALHVSIQEAASGATALGKAVDAVAGLADVGVPALAVRDDALAALDAEDGDYTFLRVSSTGALHVTGSAGVTEKANGVAWGAADLGVQVLAVRRDTATAGTGVADADYGNLGVDASGRLWTHNVDLTPAGDTMVDDTNDALRVTVVTGVQDAGVVASTGLTINKAGGQITSATTTTLVSLTSSQVIQIIALVLKNGALANNITLQDNTGPTNLVGTSAVFNLSAFEGLVLDPKASGWFNATGSGEQLDLVTSSAGPLTWYLEYTKG